MAREKKSTQIRQLFNISNGQNRHQWRKINVRGNDFAHDVQLTESQIDDLKAQGMPYHSVNRILPVVEMLNFYATANNPRWRAVGVEGSDSAVAAVFSSLSEYVWHLSDGQTKYGNVINDSITKSLGYMICSVDTDMDDGAGEVVLDTVHPWDVFPDPKSRDMLFRDAGYIFIRKLLPKSYLIRMFPNYQAKIKKATGNDSNYYDTSEKEIGGDQHLFNPHDDYGMSDVINPDGTHEQLIEYFEMYEKIRVPYVNVFYRKPLTKAQLKQAQQAAKVYQQEITQEMQVQLMEQQQQMMQAVQEGKMLQARMDLEMQKAQKMAEQQIQVAVQEHMSKVQAELSKIENKIVSQKEYDKLASVAKFAKQIVDAIKFNGTRIRQTVMVGDIVLWEKVLHERVTEYPIVPFHYKWTGTPFPMSAVSPLVGKQMEINKMHQLLIHNATLGSSLRWIYEEGTIDARVWEKYSASPGALLPVKPGAEKAPQPVLPAQLPNAFFTLIQNDKNDMEYLAGIYASMQGDTSSQHETFRGMLALDEYGTRRIKQWMKQSIEPSLRQLGKIILQFTQATYTANKRFRIVQPSHILEEREVEFNIPLYSDMGEAIGKSMDYQACKMDVRIVSGSTMPVNRWAYLAELKELLQLGVVDDLAVLAETDIKDKERIAQRKSQYAQMAGKIEQMEEALSDSEGTVETLERQLVQAGIKEKVTQAALKVGGMEKDYEVALDKILTDTAAKQKVLNEVTSAKAQMQQSQEKSVDKNKNNS